MWFNLFYLIVYILTLLLHIAVHCLTFAFDRVLQEMLSVLTIQCIVVHWNAKCATFFVLQCSDLIFALNPPSDTLVRIFTMHRQRWITATALIFTRPGNYRGVGMLKSISLLLLFCICWDRILYLYGCNCSLHSFLLCHAIIR